MELWPGHSGGRRACCSGGSSRCSGGQGLRCSRFQGRRRTGLRQPRGGTGTERLRWRLVAAAAAVIGGQLTRSAQARAPTGSHAVAPKKVGRRRARGSTAGDSGKGGGWGSKRGRGIGPVKKTGGGWRCGWMDLMGGSCRSKEGGGCRWRRLGGFGGWDSSPRF